MDGPLVYGDLVHIDKKTYIRIGEGGQWAVAASSVSQLVGYDKNGEEVYEGDILEYDYPSAEKSGEFWHYEYKAHMKGFATTENGCYIPCEKLFQSRKRQE